MHASNPILTLLCTMHGAYQQPHQFNTLIVILNQINSLNHFIYQLSNVTSLSDSSLFKSLTVKKLVHVIMNNFKYIVMFFVIGCCYLMTELVFTKIYNASIG